MSDREAVGTDDLRFRLVKDGAVYATGVQFASGTVVYERNQTFDGDVTVKPGEDGVRRLKDELPEDIDFEWVEADIDSIHEADDQQRRVSEFGGVVD